MHLLQLSVHAEGGSEALSKMPDRRPLQKGLTGLVSHSPFDFVRNGASNRLGSNVLKWRQAQESEGVGDAVGNDGTITETTITTAPDGSTTTVTEITAPAAASSSAPGLRVSTSALRRSLKEFHLRFKEQLDVFSASTQGIPVPTVGTGGFGSLTTREMPRKNPARVPQLKRLNMTGRRLKLLHDLTLTAMGQRALGIE